MKHLHYHHFWGLIAKQWRDKNRNDNLFVHKNCAAPKKRENVFDEKYFHIFKIFKKLHQVRRFSLMRFYKVKTDNSFIRRHKIEINFMWNLIDFQIAQKITRLSNNKQFSLKKLWNPTKGRLERPTWLKNDANNGWKTRNYDQMWTIIAYIILKLPPLLFEYASNISSKKLGLSLKCSCISKV